MKRPGDKEVHLLLSAEERADLKAYAAGRHLTVTAVIRLAVNQYLRRQDASITPLEVRPPSRWPLVS